MREAMERRTRKTQKDLVNENKGLRKDLIETEQNRKDFHRVCRGKWP